MIDDDDLKRELVETIWDYIRDDDVEDDDVNDNGVNRDDVNSDDVDSDDVNDNEDEEDGKYGKMTSYVFLPDFLQIFCVSSFITVLGVVYTVCKFFKETYDNE